MKNLKLERPLTFIDVETTGLNTSYDRIVELTVLKIFPDGSEEQKSVRINPEVPIPPAATKIHGITDEDVAHEPPFRRYAKGMLSYLDGCDLAGFGIIRFDIPISSSEFKRAGVELDLEGRRVVDPLFIYHKLEPRDLATAYRTYCGKELEKAHTSAGDARASSEILDALLSVHSDLPSGMDQLHEFCHPREPDWIDDEGRLIQTEKGASASTSGRLGRNISPQRHRTASKAPSDRSRASASISRNSTFVRPRSVALSRSMASIWGDWSVPITLPMAPTRPGRIALTESWGFVSIAAMIQVIRMIRGYLK